MIAAKECLKSTVSHVKQWLHIDITKQAKFCEKKITASDEWFDSKKAQKFFAKMTDNDKFLLYSMMSELWYHGYCLGREKYRKEIAESNQERGLDTLN
jgi:hypothetical protein